jgi:hypothetical protein
MSFRPAAAVLLLSLATTGCTTTFDILPSEVGCLRSGTVRTVGGREASVRPEYSVELEAHDGAKFMLEPGTTTIIAVPEYDVPLARARSFERVSQLEGPLAATLDDGHITVVNGGFRVWAGSVKELEIKQFSPGKTAALALGVTGGAGMVIGLVALMIQGLSGLGGIAGR